MGTRQETGIFLLVVILALLQLGDLWPKGAGEGINPTCNHPVLVRAGPFTDGLVCSQVPGQTDREAIARALGKNCPLPATIPPASLITAKGTACKLELQSMTGIQRLVTEYGIDPNKASPEDMQAIPGIGPVLSQRIVDHKNREGRYDSIEDLLEVKGIGPRTLERIRPYILTPPAQSR